MQAGSIKWPAFKNVLMLKISFVSLLFITANIGFAQTNPALYASTISASDLKKHLTVIASAEMEGRETATEGQRKAAAYIEAYFKSLGLKPGNKNSYQQVFPLMEDTLSGSSLKIGKRKYVFAKDYLVSVRSNRDAKVKANKIVFAGYGIADSLY